MIMSGLAGTVANIFIYRIMVIKVGVLICLITLTRQLVHSKVITINITSGNSNQECCTKEGCMCASLSIALQYIDSNTTINITSSSVMLEESVKLGSGNLTNITITGSNVTIMCNNSGSVYCESCDHVMIEGITWDRCGDPNGINIAGLTFNGTNSISLVNCTFQYSQMPAVTLLDVSENINVNHCNFLSNRISDSYFNDNDHGLVYTPLPSYALGVKSAAVWHITITNTTFVSNKGNVIGFIINGNVSIELRELDINNNSEYGNLLEFKSGSYDAPVLVDNNQLDKAEIFIINSSFTNNHGSIVLSPSTSKVLITLVDVEISHNMPGDYGVLTIYFLDSNPTTFYNYKAIVNFTRVNVMSNKYLSNYIPNEGIVYIQFRLSNQHNSVICEECKFFNNTSISNHGVFYISNDDDYRTVYATVTILNSNIHHNYGSGNIIYLSNMKVIVNSSNFTDNVASAIHLVKCYLQLTGTVIFANNTADNGGALYIEHVSINSWDTTKVQFINNSATQYGGAMYIDVFDDPHHCLVLYGFYIDYMVSFVNNTAAISGNSLYFYIPTHCKVESNINDDHSILHIPCQFNYSQPVNGKMMNIPCDLDYTLLNGTGAPIVASPHELRLYFPFNEGYNISSTSDHNVYCIRSNVLGYPVKFTGNVFDYFGKPTEPTQFDVQCVNCSSFIVLPKVHFLVDNITSLSITFSGSNIKYRMNVNVTLTSIVHSIKEINTILVVELMPCIDHPGYTYSTAHKACVCYHHNDVDCYDSYNEIKRGYWFGSVSNTATTAPCHHYCKFTGRTETRQGYFELPKTIDGQCNDHRVGRACGECSSGYTLSYDTSDCISVDQCGAGWTVLVITLTCLYWIAMVAGVFALMYFRSQISLGYLYGLIYYYSMVGILLNINPYVSDDAFQFASVLSSFAQLTPQFLGKLCFVKDLSGIDQLFIHYSHAVGVSLLLLLIVVAARWSARVTLFISRCIIRVICLLILLSYTSIVSTSLQLLQPLRFTDVKEWYTYTSPDIQYFHGRHAVYGVVAIICELVVGIGLLFLLLFESFLSRKINFIRIKPLLDQFQGCYKDKYRWFAAYYLMCRHIIFLIVYNFNTNYYDMLFYLQTTCVVIAMIHVWIQPYQNEFLNALDSVILLCIVLEVNITMFPYLKSMATEVSLVIVIFPLILLSAFIIKKMLHFCLMKWHHRHYNPINDFVDDERVSDVVIRYVASYVLCC